MLTAAKDIEQIDQLKNRIERHEDTDVPSDARIAVDTVESRLCQASNLFLDRSVFVWHSQSFFASFLATTS